MSSAENGLKVINVDRLNSLPGSGPFDNDFAIVVSTTETEPHPVTKQPQRKVLFRGTLKDAHEFVRAAVALVSNPLAPRDHMTACRVFETFPATRETPAEYGVRRASDTEDGE